MLSRNQNLAALAESKKKKDRALIEKEIAQGKKLQAAIIEALNNMDADKLYKNRDEFEKNLNKNKNLQGFENLEGLTRFNEEKSQHAKANPILHERRVPYLQPCKW